MTDTDEREAATASSPNAPLTDDKHSDDPRARIWRVSVPSRN